MFFSKAWFACVFFLCLAAPIHLFADSFSVTTDASQFQPRLGPTFCHESGTSSASCSIDYALFNGHLQGGASAQASGTFGSLLGQAAGGGDQLIPEELSYYASFSRYATVTGATGNGTLISHYQLSAFGYAMQTGASSYGSVPAGGTPSFYFVQGSERTSFQPVLTVLDNCQSAYGNACYSGTFDVTTPFAFGDPLAFGAETQAFPGARGGSYESMASSVALTGYTVLDNAGNLVSAATVTPSAAADLNFFVPEPSSIALACLGFAALLLAVRRTAKSK